MCQACHIELLTSTFDTKTISVIRSYSNAPQVQTNENAIDPFNITQLFSHTNSATQFFIPHLFHLSHSALTWLGVNFHIIKFLSVILLHTQIVRCLLNIRYLLVFKQLSSHSNLHSWYCTSSSLHQQFSRPSSTSPLPTVRDKI